MNFDETAWVAVAFIIFIALIWKRASKSITTILDERSLLIDKSCFIGVRAALKTPDILYIKI